MTQRTCSASDCDADELAKGLCNRHYKRMRKFGTLDLPEPEPLETRLWSRVDKSEDCWLWTGAKTAVGYGALRVDGVVTTTHRIAYELTHGPIPAGLEVDHTCRNRICCNPTHLRLATRKQNGENLAVRRDSGTKVRGVQWDECCKRYRVRVRHNGQFYWGGRHASIAEAERVAIEMRNQLHTHNSLDRAGGASDGPLTHRQ